MLVLDFEKPHGRTQNTTPSFVVEWQQCFDDTLQYVEHVPGEVVRVTNHGSVIIRVKLRSGLSVQRRVKPENLTSAQVIA